MERITTSNASLNLDSLNAFITTVNNTVKRDGVFIRIDRTHDTAPTMSVETEKTINTAYAAFSAVHPDKAAEIDPSALAINITEETDYFFNELTYVPNPAYHLPLTEPCPYIDTNKASSDTSLPIPLDFEGALYMAQALNFVTISAKGLPTDATSLEAITDALNEASSSLSGEDDTWILADPNGTPSQGVYVLTAHRRSIPITLTIIN